MTALAVVVVVAVLVVAVLAAAVFAWQNGRAAASPGPALAAASAAPASPSSAAPSSAGPASPPALASAASPSASASPSSLSVREPGLPDPVLTPGAVNPDVTAANLHSTICAKGWTATVRPPSSYTTVLKRRQIAAYGYADTNLAHYEEDHLVSLELGGAPSDPANLWPEPYTVVLADGTKVGARVKDQLENRLNDLVCSGAMPLATAQHLIATDWLDAWRRYVAP